MATVEEMIKSSICFGVAYDGSVKECKICEVRTKCKAKCECGTGSIDTDKLPKKPEKPEQAPLADKDEVSNSDKAVEKSLKKEQSGTAKKPPKKQKPSEVRYEDGMPNFKEMSIEDIEKMLKDKGEDLSGFEKYVKNPNIHKMRLTMAIKKHYEIH